MCFQNGRKVVVSEFTRESSLQSSLIRFSPRTFQATSRAVFSSLHPSACNCQPCGAGDHGRLCSLPISLCNAHHSNTPFPPHTHTHSNGMQHHLTHRPLPSFFHPCPCHHHAPFSVASHTLDCKRFDAAPLARSVCASCRFNIDSRAATL